MNIPAVRAAIAKLGQGPYQDGSSATPGWTYQPIGDWFPELKDIPCHKPEAVRDDFWAVVRDYVYSGGAWDHSEVIDLGAANGYYVAGLRRFGAWTSGVERDPAAREVIKALWLTTQEIGEAAFEPHGSRHKIALALNLPMWWVKQGVNEEMMQWCVRNANTTYFQTAGKHSGGMCIIPELDSEEAEERYLKRYFAGVHHVRDTTLHGGIRRLWRCTS